MGQENDLRHKPVGSSFYHETNTTCPGRFWRPFAAAFRVLSKSDPNIIKVCYTDVAFDIGVKSCTNLELYRRIMDGEFPDVYETLDNLPLRRHDYLDDAAESKLTSIPEEYSRMRDPELHYLLIDLARQIAADLAEACNAIRNPDMYYPGVDHGIEPVTEEHVDLVIWATQRELNRETREWDTLLFIATGKKRPAVQLSKLPRRIQRAFVERRRLRYQQWGITHQNWEENRWSLWNITDDDWIPPPRFSPPSSPDLYYAGLYHVD